MDADMNCCADWDFINKQIEDGLINAVYCEPLDLDDAPYEYKALIAYTFLVKACRPRRGIRLLRTDKFLSFEPCGINENAPDLTSWLTELDADPEDCLVIFTSEPLEDILSLFNVSVRDEYDDCSSICVGSIFSGCFTFSAGGEYCKVERFADAGMLRFVKARLRVLNAEYYFSHLDEAYEIVRDAIHEYRHRSIIQPLISKED